MSQDHSLPYRLLAPGPVPVPTQVLKAMGEKVLHHRTPEFVEILQQTWQQLSRFFATHQSVQIITGTGSAAMEAAVVNTLSPGDQALVVVSGKFGERWADICERYGVQTQRWNVPWGKTLDLHEFAAQLKAHPAIKVVFSQVCETSTATLHPVREMAEVMRKTRPEALFAVDAITGLGCLSLPMDEWGLDVVVGGSQKAFMIPTGLSFIALSERAWAAQALSRCTKYYFDLHAEKKANAKGDSQFSIPTPLIVGLHQVLLQAEKVGLPSLWKRCQTLSEATLWAGEKLGLKGYSDSPSPSVTALTTSSDSAKLRDELEAKYNITIMGGQDQLKGKILRVGHMGDVRDEDMLALFQALAEMLKQTSVYDSFASELRQRLQQAQPLFS
jgi:aspartate aminotransferase-like enzyme